MEGVAAAMGCCGEWQASNTKGTATRMLWARASFIQQAHLSGKALAYCNQTSGPWDGRQGTPSLTAPAGMAPPNRCFDDLRLVRAAKVTAKVFRPEGKDQKQHHDDAAFEDGQRKRVSEVVAEQIFDRDRR